MSASHVAGDGSRSGYAQQCKVDHIMAPALLACPVSTVDQSDCLGHSPPWTSSSRHSTDFAIGVAASAAELGPGPRPFDASIEAAAHVRRARMRSRIPSALL